MITRPLREDGMLFIFCVFCVLWYLVSFFAAEKVFSWFIHRVLSILRNVQIAKNHRTKFI